LHPIALIVKLHSKASQHIPELDKNEDNRTSRYYLNSETLEAAISEFDSDTELDINDDTNSDGHIQVIML
jgi:hypothetical protein